MFVPVASRHVFLGFAQEAKDCCTGDVNKAVLVFPQPMGIAFEEIDDGNGAIVVGFTEKSNGAKYGVKVGETLVACR